MESHAEVRAAVLGPLRVEVDGSRVPIPGRSLRRLLVRLLLARGAVVADGDLLRDVWGPEAALPTLHTAVARLRHALEPGRADHAPGRVLVRDGAGYALVLARGGLDADRFVAAARRGAALLDAGRPAEARAALDEALGEWSGPALGDVADRRFAEAEVRRLDGLRVDALELRTAASARMGDPGAIAELEAFTAAHPARERAWELLVRALCADERPTDALSAIRRARRVVREATGTDLGPGLVALQHAVLRGTTGPLPDRRPVVARTRLLPTTNLPTPISTLVGRREELDALAAELDAARLVVLVGPGGAGKTRLAVEACRRRTDQDGPWLVDAADVEAAALLPERIARALGVGAGDADGLARAIGDRRTLLVLDNCEQIAEAAGALVGRLLASCPRLAVLATSREPLGVPGERVVPIAPLSGGEDGDAVRLFLARAAEASGRVLGPDEVAEADALCAELDGLPLAIELAAARSGALTVQDLRAALTDRFALLRRDGRSGRHATMLAAVDWSYRALDDDERAVFQALAVFRGGFRLDAAEAVAGRSDTAVVVARLVARSLIQVQETRPRRFRLLETLREHAARCTPPGRADELRGRHLAWVRDLAREAGPALRGRLGSSATVQLQEEAANIRAALTVADPATVLAIGGGFYWFWYREGLVTEGLGHLLPAIDREAPDAQQVDLADRCRAAMGAALLLYLRGDLDRARAALARAGADAAASGQDSVLAQYLSTVAYFEAGGGSLGAAREHAESALGISRRCGDRSAAAESLMVLGEVARREGALDEAAAVLREAIDESERSGYVWAGISSEWIASKVELAAGRTASGLRTAIAASRHALAAGETTSGVVGLVTVARAAQVLDDERLAGTAAGAARWIGGRIGFDPARMDADLAAWTPLLDPASGSAAFATAWSDGRWLSPERLDDALRAAAARWAEPASPA